MEKEHKVEEEVSELKGKMSSMENQMGEMMKMMTTLLQTRSPVVDSTDTPQMTTSVKNTREVQGGSFSKPVVHIGAADVMMKKPQETHVPLQEDHSYPQWN